MKNLIIKTLIGTVIVCLFSAAAIGQEKVFFKTLPVPSGTTPSTDPSIPTIGWNRWTTKNFTINSIDIDQGEYLFNNIESMKTWCLERWGLPDIQFSAECRIFCAPNVDMMKKLFNLDRTCGGVKQVDGKLVISYLWVVIDGKPTEVIPSPLTIICLKEFNYQNRLNIGWWLYKGMSVLNSSIPQIKNNVVLASQNKTPFSSKSFFSATEDDMRKATLEQKQLFDAQAATMCLLIRKEYGQKKFLLFLRNSNSEHVVKEYLGFTNLETFDITFHRFKDNLANDISQNRTPDSYLQIEKLMQK
jgi:hypothetical protein